MRKQRSFEENTIQNFQIQQQFQKLMQIEGLAQSREPQQELFPSLKMLFQNQAPINIVGRGPNSNIRGFYYLLLCHIRKVHLTRLINQHQQKEVQKIESEGQVLRDRKVSFNGKGVVFLNGPQYQNYALHKLKIYAFSSCTDLTIIKNSPFDWDPAFKFIQQPLSSQQLKRLLSQFLKELLPETLPKDYKINLKSVRYHLNKHHIAGVILSMVMRHILYSKYQIQSAGDFQEEVSDHTVCTTLCDAFAIDGLICKQSLYEINTWCKVYSINSRAGRLIFVELFNDQFEDMGSKNDRNGQNLKEKAFREVPKGIEIIKERENLLVLPTEDGQLQSESIIESHPNSNRSSQDGSGSMMDNDEDSEIPSDESSSSKSGSIYEDRYSKKFQSSSKEETKGNNEAIIQDHDGFRSTFNIRTSKIQLSIQKQLQDNQQKQSYLEQQPCTVKTERQQIKNQDLAQTPFKKKSLCQQNLHDQSLSFRRPLQMSTQYTSKPFNIFDQSKQAISGLQNSTQKAEVTNCTSKIVNNNISNNIYLTLGEGSKYMPFISISTDKADPKGININLK